MEVAEKRKVKIRSMIVSRPGYVLASFDLKQAESWVVAYLANEARMKDALQHDDIHLVTAAEAFKPYFKLERAQVTKEVRYTAKRFNHATCYRMGPGRAIEIINKDANELGLNIVLTQKDGKELYDLWHSFYHLKAWWDQIEWQLMNNARTLRTPYGRLRTFFDAPGNELWKKATAHVPQSTVSDHMKGKVQKEVGVEGGLKVIYEHWVKPGHLFLCHEGHDSAVLELPLATKSDLIPQVYSTLLRPLVINGEEFTIPVDIEVGERWGELEPYEVKV